MPKNKNTCKLTLVGDMNKKTRRKKEKTYDEKVFQVLKKVWYICVFVVKDLLLIWKR